MLAIGLMSGTSCDGIDAALIETDGRYISNFIAEAHIDYPIEFQKQLLNLMYDRNHIFEIEKKLTYYHFDAIKMLGDVKADIIGFHGQTVAYNPLEAICHQIGNPYLLQKLTNTAIVSDFRYRDISRGGRGAPLVPIFHQTITTHLAKPLAIVNIGGIANITYITKNNELHGYDIGPGNALIDDAMLRYYDLPYDRDGQIARSGNIAQNILDSVTYEIRIPKSLDRNHFKYMLDIVSSLRKEDAVATLTAITAKIISNSIPNDVRNVYLCGGGVKNQTLCMHLGEYKSHCNIHAISEIGYKPEYIEAQAFAFLAARCVANLPSSFPSTTGVSEPTISGTIFT